MSNRQLAWSWQAVSNIAVLLGVFLVILQLRQNADLLEMQLIKQESESYVQNLTEILPEDFTDTMFRAVENPQELSRKEIFEVDLFLWSRGISRWRSLYDLAERGLLSHSEWQRAVSEDAASVFAYPFGRAYWDNLKESQSTIPDELIQAIDSVLAESSPNSTTEWLDDLERRLGIERVNPTN
jgi:hypothetical protein